MSRDDASEVVRRLAQNAEAVCRHYLSNGRREGRIWRVGDVDNTPGRSMAVRLTGPDSGPGAALRPVTREVDPAEPIREAQVEVETDVTADLLGAHARTG